jgi:hypothetical protein
MIARRTWFGAALTLTLVALPACDDGRKVAEQSAADTLAKLIPTVKDDVEQVRVGLPAGAVRLTPMLDADTLANPNLLQKTITRTRGLVPQLDVAKSTFFTITDTTGTSLRSEVDPDLLVGKSMIAAFPPLKQALSPDAKVVEAWGEMKELRAVKNGPDIAWVVATPILDDKAAVKAVFVTGWSLRAYARRLENAAQGVVKDLAEKAGKKNPSLVYVFVVKGKTAYGAPIAPEVNAQAVELLDPVAKTASGPYRGTLEITNRGFGVAVARVPELGDDVAVAVLATEF